MAEQLCLSLHLLFCHSSVVSERSAFSTVVRVCYYFQICGSRSTICDCHGVLGGYKLGRSWQELLMKAPIHSGWVEIAMLQSLSCALLAHPKSSTAESERGHVIIACDIPQIVKWILLFSHAYSLIILKPTICAMAAVCHDLMNIGKWLHCITNRIHHWACFQQHHN